MKRIKISLKKLTLLVLTASPSLLFGQGNFIINGKLGPTGVPNSPVFLSYDDGSKIINDTTTVHNGEFTFSGHVKDITKAKIWVDYGTIWVYLAKGTTTLMGEKLTKATISGAPVEDDYKRYLAIIKAPTDAEKVSDKEFSAAPEEKRNSKEFRDYYIKKDSVFDSQLKALNKQYVTANPNSYVSFDALEGMAGNYPEFNDLQPEFLKLSPSLRASRTGIAYQKYLDLLKAVAVGSKAPDFIAPDTSGNIISLSSFRGKYILVDFWASWCSPCRAENPNVMKAFNNFKDKNFTIISVSLDNKRWAWLDAIHQDGLTWNQVSSLKSWNNNDIIKLYGLEAIPQNFLIDPTGKIIGKNLRGDELNKTLAALFN